MTTEELRVVMGYNECLGELMGDPGRLKEGLARFLTEDAVCIEAPSIPWGGTWTGVDGYVTMFGIGSALQAQGRLAVAPETWPPSESYWQDGSTVIRRMQFGVVDPESGETVDLRSIEMYELAEGRIKGIEVFFFDTALIARLCSVAAA